MTQKKATQKQETATKAAGNDTANATTEQKKIKLNLDSYSKWQYKAKPRVENEETEDKGRLTHAPKGKRESDGYFNSRAFAFEVAAKLGKQGKEFKTPQRNCEMVMNLINSRLPKDKQITRFVYVARTFELRFYPADMPKDEYVAVNVQSKPNTQAVLKHFGVTV